MTRGIRQNSKLFVEQLSAQYFPWKGTGRLKSGKDDLNVQVAMRPIQLWEVVFPKEALQTVMRTVWNPNEKCRFAKQLLPLRLALGAKKMPKMELPGPKRIVYRENVAIYAIGIKEDAYTPEGIEDL